MKILISSCLLGDNVRYSGGNNYSDTLIKIIKKYKLDIIKICPEIMGGLSIPRKPAEINNEDVIDIEKKSVKKEFYEGAKKVIELIKDKDVKFAILKDKSPSCGVNFIYDGTFSNTLIDGEGITTKFLRRNRIEVFSEKELDKFLEKLL